jgi:hypothetical protein
MKQHFTQSLPVSPTNKTVCHDITEILLKVALNAIKQKPNPEEVEQNNEHYQGECRHSHHPTICSYPSVLLRCLISTQL